MFNKEAFEKNAGVYKITNTLNNKVYIGSSDNIQRRLNSHYNNLSINKSHNAILQRSWNKNGNKNFTFEVIEYCMDGHQALIREQYWIDKTQCCNRKYGYNISPTANSTLGIKRTEEQIIKNSLAKRGEGSPTAIIDEKTASTIKTMLNAGIKHDEIHKTLSINKEIVRSIRRNLAWKYVEPLLLESILLEDNKKKLSETDVEEVKNMLRNGIKVKNIAEHFKVNYRTISAVKNNINWKSEGNESFSKRKNVLLDMQVIEIRDLHRDENNRNKIRKQEICKMFNISDQVYNGIVSKRTYKHVN